MSERDASAPDVVSMNSVSMISVSTDAMSMDAVFRHEYGRLLATLVRQFRDLDLAEDAASDAIEAAVRRWPVDGLPAAPGAWLLTAARRKAVDSLRRDQVRSAKFAVLGVESNRIETDVCDRMDAELPDDRLQLFFLCAHPALAHADRLALMLRCLAGLTTGEVARALLVPPATAAQRIVRAKNKLRGSNVGFGVPGSDELPERVPMVLQVLYSIFTEGYSASSGDSVVRTELSRDAIRLTRLLHTRMPLQREVTGLLALMVLTDSRRAARIGADGEIVLLGDQDRGLWNTVAIEEGIALVTLALSSGPPGPYAVQAAIAAVHCEAPHSDDTDWPQIVALYDVLHALTPDPLVAMNRAVAIAMRDGPEAGLAELDRIAGEPALRRYHAYPTARADLMQRLGRFDDAAREYRRALDFARTSPEKRLLQRRLAELSPDTGQAEGAASNSKASLLRTADTAISVL